MAKRLTHIFFIVCLISCSEENKPAIAQFSNLSSTTTSLNFNNRIIENEEVNFYKYQYLYNGGGVAIGDINNDGLQDVYFTSTLGSDKLYLNEGDFNFKDISETCGINTEIGFKAGVTMVDINADGLLDIYVSRAGWSKYDGQRHNLLYINKGNLQFEESAKSYGLDSKNHSIQAGFLDFDHDGDLDMILANHPGEFKVPSEKMLEYMASPTIEMSDQFFRNDGNKFVDITKEAGLLNYSYSLGLAIADIDQDGWTDIYMANDFQQHDYYYKNNGDGTFTESLKEYFPHCSYFSMGSEIVDINNDGALDIFVVEMLAEDNMRQKTNMASMNPDRFWHMVQNDMHYQYMRNTLHINHGNGHFSDVAEYSGLGNTDWSWGTILADFDHDEDCDITVVNGYLRDTQDKDFSKKSGSLAKKNNNALSFSQAYSLLKSTRLENYAFENLGNLKFKKVSSQWGFDFSGYSNGLATGDLDNDGDLDLIVNNINDEASVYRNNQNDDEYLMVYLRGDKGNPQGLNAQVILYQGESKQIRSIQPTRGFHSSSQASAHFGVNNTIDKLEVLWNDGTQQTILSPKKGQSLEIVKRSSTIPDKQNTPGIYSELKNAGFQNYFHNENYFDDYKRQVLLPHKLSQLGPGIAKSDLNKDGLDDFYVCGPYQQAGELWIQNDDGNFSKKAIPAFDKDKNYEDVEAIFVDVNGDQLDDLYVVSGGNEFDDQDEMYQDRLYLASANGDFKRTNLPEIRFSGQACSAADFDQDGDLDLFVGFRHSPGKYPFTESSIILKNDNGQLKIDDQDLASAGMVSSSQWSDFDQDGDLDLITVGEWTSVKIFENVDHQLQTYTMPNEESLLGWWNVIKTKDLNNDGLEDIVLGNLGENYKYKASEDAPFEIYANDFDKNGKSDIVLGYYNDDKLYPVRGFQCSSEQIPDLKKEIPSYEVFGASTLIDVYGEDLDSSFHIKASNFSSVVLWNRGGGKFDIQTLPYQAQLSPIKDLVIYDINNDGHFDIVSVGNWFVAEVETPRADAGVGLVLLGDGKEGFKVMPLNESGFFSKDDARSIELIKGKSGLNILVGNNYGPLQFFKRNPSQFVD